MPGNTVHNGFPLLVVERSTQTIYHHTTTRNLHTKRYCPPSDSRFSRSPPALYLQTKMDLRKYPFDVRTQVALPESQPTL